MRPIYLNSFDGLCTPRIFFAPPIRPLTASPIQLVKLFQNAFRPSRMPSTMFLPRFFQSVFLNASTTFWINSLPASRSFCARSFRPSMIFPTSCPPISIVLANMRATPFRRDSISFLAHSSSLPALLISPVTIFSIMTGICSRSCGNALETPSMRDTSSVIPASIRRDIIAGFVRTSTTCGITAESD